MTTDPLNGCPEFDERLIDAVFAPGPDAGLEAHLAACERCRAARARYLVTSDALGAAFAQQDDAPAEAARSRGLPTWLWVAAASVLVALPLWMATRTDDAPHVGTEPALQVASVDRYVLKPGPPITLRASARPLEVTTPLGALRCERGTFAVHLRKLTEVEAMSRKMKAGMAITVLVTAGVVTWALPDGDVEVREGETVTRTCGGHEKPAPQPKAPTGEGIRSVPFDDARKEKPEVEPPRGELRGVHVQTEDGRPVAGAFVVVFEAQRVLASGTTQAGGHLPLPADAKSGDVFVLADGHAPLRTALVKEKPTTTVTLSRGARLGGHVLVDGAVPTRPVRLSLYGSSKSLDIGRLPPAVHAELKKHRRGSNGFRTHTDAQGRFAVAGLPDDWKGMIWVENRYHLEGSKDRKRGVSVGQTGGGLHIDAPRDGIELRLVTSPGIEGRLVTTKREPVPGATIWLKFVKGESYSTTTLKSGPDGRFHSLLQMNDLTELRLGLRGVPDGDKALLVIDKDLDKLQDLGDIVVGEERRVTFIVQDERGTPIAGAIALLGNAQSESTKADGRGNILGTSAENQMLVTALGYEVAEVPLSAASPTPLIVKLRRSPLLRIEVKNPDGTPADKVSVLLLSREPLFDSDWRVHPAHRAAGATDAGFAFGRGAEKTLPFEPDAQGRVTITGFRPGVAFTVRIVDAAGTTLDERHLQLDPDEPRTERFALRQAQRTVQLVATGPDGETLPVIAVTIHCGHASNSYASPNGSMKLSGIYGTGVTLDIQAQGYEPVERQRFELPERGPLRIKLRKR